VSRFAPGLIAERYARELTVGLIIQPLALQHFRNRLERCEALDLE